MYNSEHLESILSEIIDKRVKRILKDKGYETPYEGRVLAIEQSDDNSDPYAQYAEVDVIGYDTTVYLRNITGELLVRNDKVRIYANNGNLSNGYIGIKCN
jgi:hypothetical protein